MGPEGSLLRLQVPATCFYPEPYQSIPCPPPQFSNIYSLILPSTPGSSKSLFPSGFRNAVHYEVEPLTSVAHLFKLLQQFAPFQHSAECLIPGCKQLRLTMKEDVSRFLTQPSRQALLQVVNINTSASNLFLKNPRKRQFGEQKAPAEGSCCGQRLWICGHYLAPHNGCSHHHHLAVCSVAGTTHLTAFPCCTEPELTDREPLNRL